MIARRPPETDPHVQRVLEWRECLTTLPDNHFFALMRMYLGEVKTPYNKQKLIEELSAFLRKDENRRTLARLLSGTDIEIISAVWFLGDATHEKLNEFFSGVFSFAALYERLMNLEERLILYSKTDRLTGKEIYHVNPLLEEVLQPFISADRLLPEAEWAEHTDIPVSMLTPQLIAAFVSYISENPSACKLDGSLKKRAGSALEERFPGKRTVLEQLVTAFINLSLVKENENGFYLDYPRCLVFAGMDEQFQYAYLCTAACGRFSREGFRSQSQLLLDTCASVPEKGCTRTVLLRAGVLAGTIRSQDSSMDMQQSRNRFSRLLEQYRPSGALQGEEPSSDSSIMDRLADAGLVFGLFTVSGKSADGQDILTVDPVFRGKGGQSVRDGKVLSIDAGFTVTVMPGLPLKELLPLARFMDIVHYDAAAEFEITRKSVLRAFDGGETPQSILKELSMHTSYGIPQNLSVSIDDWYRSYNSAVLYSGFVLKVDTENSLLTEKNPLLAPHIKAVLAPGVYLLDAADQQQVASLAESCGSDFIGKVKTVQSPVPVTGFPALASGTDYLEQEPQKVSPMYENGSEQSRAEYFAGMKKTLKAMNLDEAQEEGLASRISRKIVLNAVQLRPDSVRIEKMEASGMDFMGKIRIVERALASSSMIEIGFNDKPAAGTHDAVPPRILGTPLSIEKQEEDAMVRLRIEPEQTERIFSIGQAAFIKRIRGSIFNEEPVKE